MDNFITEMLPPQIENGRIRNIWLFITNFHYFVGFRPRSSLELFADLTFLLQHTEGSRDYAQTYFRSNSLRISTSLLQFVAYYEQTSNKLPVHWQAPA
jgi:hypothetical protein